MDVLNNIDGCNLLNLFYNIFKTHADSYLYFERYSLVMILISNPVWAFMYNIYVILLNRLYENIRLKNLL